MFKRMISRLLDYVAYIILGMVGLTIFNALYITWFTETGRLVISFFMIVIAIIWATVRSLKKR